MSGDPRVRITLDDENDPLSLDECHVEDAQSVTVERMDHGQWQIRIFRKKLQKAGGSYAPSASVYIDLFAKGKTKVVGRAEENL